MIREVILQKLTGEMMRKHIFHEAEIRIAEEAQKEFIDDVMEDLQQIDTSRLAGLGVTPEQLQEWVHIRETS